MQQGLALAARHEGRIEVGWVARRDHCIGHGGHPAFLFVVIQAELQVVAYDPTLSIRRTQGFFWALTAAARGCGHRVLLYVDVL